MLQVEERDVFMSRENQLELMERMGTGEEEDGHLRVPQVFVEGRHLGVSAMRSWEKPAKWKRVVRCSYDGIGCTRK